MNQDTFEKNTNEKPKYDFEELKAEHKAHLFSREVGYLFCTILFIVQHKMGKDYSAELLAVLTLSDTVFFLELCQLKPKRKKYLKWAIFNGILFLIIMAVWLWYKFIG